MNRFRADKPAECPISTATKNNKPKVSFYVFCFLFILFFFLIVCATHFNGQTEDLSYFRRIYKIKPKITGKISAVGIK